MRGGGSHGVSSGPSPGGGLFLLLTVFLLSLLGGFIGSGLLSLLTGTNRDLGNLQRMDMKHASILHQLEETEKKFANRNLFNLNMNSVAEAVVQSMINNPNMMEELVNGAVESGAIGNLVQQAVENGAITDAFMNMIDTGAIGAALQSAIDSGVFGNLTPQELLSGFDFEGLMAAVNEMLGEVDEVAMEEAFRAWFEEMMNSIDPQMIEQLMSTVSNSALNLECTCTPSGI